MSYKLYPADLNDDLLAYSKECVLDLEIGSFWTEDIRDSNTSDNWTGRKLEGVIKNT